MTKYLPLDPIYMHEISGHSDRVLALYTALGRVVALPAREFQKPGVQTAITESTHAFTEARLMSVGCLDAAL